MAQSLVRSYSISTSNNENYAVEFSIPNNCEYAVSGSAGEFFITVQLKRGQTEPSSTFADFKVALSSSGGIITVDFVQECDSTMITKPRIRVEYY